ncbi:hypothetical protein LPUS_11378 [Lasallia pustulata]|uniref:Uncharacterized protein n=1 Tax=Lasallia pustulata TaxID=136370 RepID=A0A1W5DBM2_9LECA|nr:hypothetical protein LPUS_11378 [Lasallia pustulata]
MAQFYSQPAQPPYSTPNLQFYPSSYPVSGHTTPSQALYGNYGAPAHGNQAYAGAGFGAPVSGRMGEQGGLRTGWLAAFGTEGYEGEPALLEELGVNFAHIKVKTLTVLNPFARIDQHIMDDSDLAGPILFFLLFGTFLLFSGKVHFGYIYGLALVGSLSLHTIFSLMSPPIDPADVPHPIQDHMHQSGRSQRRALVLEQENKGPLGWLTVTTFAASHPEDIRCELSKDGSRIVRIKSRFANLENEDCLALQSKRLFPDAYAYDADDPELENEEVDTEERGLLRLQKELERGIRYIDETLPNVRRRRHQIKLQRQNKLEEEVLTIADDEERRSSMTLEADGP